MSQQRSSSRKLVWCTISYFTRRLNHDSVAPKADEHLLGGLEDLAYDANLHASLGSIALIDTYLIDLKLSSALGPPEG
jgi:hypothetical protein